MNKLLKLFSKGKGYSKPMNKPQTIGAKFTTLSKQEVEADRSKAYVYLF